MRIEDTRAGVTPGLLITFSVLLTKREQKGVAWCEKKGVGELRRILTPPRSNVVTMARWQVTKSTGYEESRQSAALFLVGFCRACRGCPMSER